MMRAVGDFLVFTQHLELTTTPTELRPNQVARLTQQDLSMHAPFVFWSNVAIALHEIWTLKEDR